MEKMVNSWFATNNIITPTQYGLQENRPLESAVLLK